MTDWIKTNLCRIVKSDGSIFNAHPYHPSELDLVLEKVKKDDPNARVQWLYQKQAQEWREEPEWAERESLAAFLAAQIHLEWEDHLTEVQKDNYRHIAAKLLRNKAASNEVERC